jgi:ribosomal protein L31
MVGKFKESDADFEKEVGKELQRWSDVAEDIGLIPERNVRVVQEGDETVVEISEEMHTFFTGESL